MKGKKEGRKVCRGEEKENRIASKVRGGNEHLWEAYLRSKEYVIEKKWREKMGRVKGMTN